MTGLKKIKLSDSEEILMNLFWSETEPLTSVELLQRTSELPWGSNYIHKLLMILQNKGFLEMHGVVKEGKHYVRQFVPRITKEDYVTHMLEDRQIGTAALTRIAMSFIKKEEENASEAERKALVDELKQMVSAWETKDKKGS